MGAPHNVLDGIWQLVSYLPYMSHFRSDVGFVNEDRDLVGPCDMQPYINSPDLDFFTQFLLIQQCTQQFSFYLLF